MQDFLYVLKNDFLLKEMNQNAFKVTRNHMTPHNHKTKKGRGSLRQEKP